FVRTTLPSIATLFPYATLFRSGGCAASCGAHGGGGGPGASGGCGRGRGDRGAGARRRHDDASAGRGGVGGAGRSGAADDRGPGGDRKSTRLNSSHVKISYAVSC